MWKVLYCGWIRQRHHMSYPRTDCTKRTDQPFRNRTDPDHHKELTAIEMPIDLIQDFIIADALHLLDLVIAKKCLTSCTFGSFNFKTKWHATRISEVSDILISCNETLPTKLHRAVRRLDCVRFLEGTRIPKVSSLYRNSCLKRQLAWCIIFCYYFVRWRYVPVMVFGYCGKIVSGLHQPTTT